MKKGNGNSVVWNQLKLGKTKCGVKISFLFSLEPIERFASKRFYLFIFNFTHICCGVIFSIHGWIYPSKHEKKPAPFRFGRKKKKMSIFKSNFETKMMRWFGYFSWNCIWRRGGKTIHFREFSMQCPGAPGERL